MEIIIIILLLIIIAFVYKNNTHEYFYQSLSTSNITPHNMDTSRLSVNSVNENIVVPPYREYYPIPERGDYIYAMRKFNKIIPFYDLDLSNPFHRWIYYYYPEFYAKYYTITFPFEGDFYKNSLERVNR